MSEGKHTPEQIIEHRIAELQLEKEELQRECAAILAACKLAASRCVTCDGDGRTSGAEYSHHPRDCEACAPYRAAIAQAEKVGG